MLDANLLCLDARCQMSTLLDTRQGLSGQESLTWLTERIAGDSPFLVARFGTTEIRSAWRSLLLSHGTLWEKAVALGRKLEPPFWTHYMFRNLSLKSGYFPINKKSVQVFTELLIDTMADIDLLGSWVPGEAVFEKYLSHSEITPIKNLSPVDSGLNWTSALSRKKVLVVHPFKDTIQSQYVKRTTLFDDPEFLPDFELRVVKAAQTRGAGGIEEGSWQENLDAMIAESLEKPFDVAILGCGSYGLPLGSALKRAGHRVIHLGGPTQLLFGIKGRRWENSGIFRDSWVRPNEHEKPADPAGLGPSPYW